MGLSQSKDLDFNRYIKKISKKWWVLAKVKIWEHLTKYRFKFAYVYIKQVRSEQRCVQYMWEWKNFHEFSWIYSNLLEFTQIYLNF